MLGRCLKANADWKHCRLFSSMKSLLLQLPGSCKLFTRSNSIYPPLGLCQLAATVSSQDCIVIDAEALDYTFEKTVRTVEDRNPVLVGFSVTTMTMHLVESYAAAIRIALPNTLILVGGPQATAAPDTVLAECPSVDLLFRGEGEESFPRVINTLSTNNSRSENLRLLSALPGVVNRSTKYPKQVEIQRVKAERFVMEPVIPFPLLSDMPLSKYWCPDALRRPMVTFMTARGCPFKCAFCATPQIIGNEVRGWEPIRVVEELERLVTKGVREVSFVDDLFTAKPARVRELCELMISRKVDLTWFANSRADRVNAALCQLMRQAGCHQIFLGVESGSNKMLKYMRKGENVDMMIRGAEYLHAAGIKISAGFIIGLPGENDDTVMETITLAKKIRPNRIQFSRWTPLAGSALVEHASEFALDPRSAPALANKLSDNRQSMDGGTIAGAQGFHSQQFRVAVEHTSSSPTDTKLASPATAPTEIAKEKELDRVDLWIAMCYTECNAKRTGETDWGMPSI